VESSTVVKQFEQSHGLSSKDWPEIETKLRGLTSESQKREVAIGYANQWISESKSPSFDRPTGTLLDTVGRITGLTSISEL
jgi:hypothetical protein